MESLLETDKTLISSSYKKLNGYKESGAMLAVMPINCSHNLAPSAQVCLLVHLERRNQSVISDAPVGSKPSGRPAQGNRTEFCSQTEEVWLGKRRGDQTRLV